MFKILSFYTLVIAQLILVNQANAVDTESIDHRASAILSLLAESEKITREGNQLYTKFTNSQGDEIAVQLEFLFSFTERPLSYAQRRNGYKSQYELSFTGALRVLNLSSHQSKISCWRDIRDDWNKTYIYILDFMGRSYVTNDLRNSLLPITSALSKSTPSFDNDLEKISKLKEHELILFMESESQNCIGSEMTLLPGSVLTK